MDSSRYLAALKTNDHIVNLVADFLQYAQSHKTGHCEVVLRGGIQGSVRRVAAGGCATLRTEDVGNVVQDVGADAEAGFGARGLSLELIHDFRVQTEFSQWIFQFLHSFGSAAAGSEMS